MYGFADIADRCRAKRCGRVPVIVAAAALLSACAADPFIDNVRATPEEKSIQQGDRPASVEAARKSGRKPSIVAAHAGAAAFTECLARTRTAPRPRP